VGRGGREGGGGSDCSRAVRKLMKNGGLCRRALAFDPGFTVNPSFPIRNYNRAFASRAARPKLIARHIFKLRLDQMQIAAFRVCACCEINR